MAKVLISVDEKLLRRIDRMAAAAGLSRSAYFARLAERDATSKRDAASVLATLRRLDRLFENAPSVDSTAEVRSARDAR